MHASLAVILSLVGTTVPGSAITQLHPVWLYLDWAAEADAAVAAGHDHSHAIHIKLALQGSQGPSGSAASPCSGRGIS